MRINLTLCFYFEIKRNHSKKYESVLQQQRQLFLSKDINAEMIAAIESNNDMYCLQKHIEKRTNHCMKINFKKTAI